ncbi:MAG: VOC family protein [Promethearchaeota archaeon]
MTKTTPYLLVKNGKSTIELYKDLFGAKLVKHMNFPENFDYENSTMRAILDFNGTEIFLIDRSFGNPPEGRVEIVLYEHPA